MSKHQEISGKGVVCSLSSLFVLIAVTFNVSAVAQDGEVMADNAPIIASAISQDPELAQLRRVQAYLMSRDDDLRTTVWAVQRFINKGKRESEPRYLGMAEAIIENWLSKYDAHPAVLLAKADILQYRHQFDDALVLLSEIPNAGVEGAAALLMRANLFQLKGDYDATRAECGRLARELSFMSDICKLHIESFSGEIEPSQRKLEALIAQLELPTEIRVWAVGKLADMSNRRGKPQEALEYLQKIKPEQASGALRAQMFDLLLLLERPNAVLQMIDIGEKSEGLQLRRLRALKMTGENWRGPISQNLLGRISRPATDASNPHARELAYYHHYLTGDVEAAFEAATENWNLQREPIDIRLLFETAHRARKLETITDAIEWISQKKYQDVRLAQFLQVKPGQS